MELDGPTAYDELDRMFRESARRWSDEAWRSLLGTTPAELVESLEKFRAAGDDRRKGQPMLVKLDYFKPSGKWYADGSYRTRREDLGDIWREVEDLQRAGKLPGLCAGSSGWIISVQVPDHPHDHPHLVMPG